MYHQHCNRPNVPSILNTPTVKYQSAHHHTGIGSTSKAHKYVGRRHTEGIRQRKQGRIPKTQVHIHLNPVRGRQQASTSLPGRRRQPITYKVEIPSSPRMVGINAASSRVEGSSLDLYPTPVTSFHAKAETEEQGMSHLQPAENEQCNAAPESRIKILVYRSRGHQQPHTYIACTVPPRKW
jgi:hypothetical protein